MRKQVDEWVMLGRKIGTATDWDKHDTFVVALYEFTPARGVSLPSGDVTFDFQAGTASTHADDGTMIECVDIVEAVASAEKAETEAV